MEKKGNKTYYFIGNLAPAELCREFNPGELSLGNNYHLDIFFNGITIWNPILKSKFVKVSPFVQEAFQVLVAAFNFRQHMLTGERHRLSFTVQRCIEAMRVKANENLIWTLDYPGKAYSPNKRARVNVTWRRVVSLFQRINQMPHHKLMLKDYQNCINDPGDNAFFFAYRVIEDMKLVIDMEVGITNEKDWSGVHSILKTDKNFMDPLIEVAKKVRHGDLHSSVIAKARQKKQRVKILGIAFELMKREFKRKFPRFL